MNAPQPKLREGFVRDEPAREPAPAAPAAVTSAPPPPAAPAPAPAAMPAPAPANDQEFDPNSAVAAIAADTWPVKVKLLYRAIRDNKNVEIKEISFREPTAGDINRHGNPVRIGPEGEAIIDDQRMMQVMASLSGILSPLLERMDPRDYASCAYRLRRFFCPDPAAWF
jgi:hypothetical protein